MQIDSVEQCRADLNTTRIKMVWAITIRSNTSILKCQTTFSFISKLTMAATSLAQKILLRQKTRKDIHTLLIYQKKDGW